MEQNNQQQQVQLAPGDLTLLEEVSLRYDAVIPANVKPETLLNPAFWAHHAVKLQPMNEIRARSIDGTWVGYYIVLDCSRTWAKVHPLSMHSLTSADVSRTQANEQDVRKFLDDHAVVYRNGKKWCVVRQTDKVAIAEDLGTKDAARDWLNNHCHEMVTTQAVTATATATATA